jgi:putative flavoprotein involved in K+ transport
MSSVENGSGRVLDTIVIGGGQAGLAIGYHLMRQDRDFAILDAHERIGDAWRLRWDSLRLFTPAGFDGLTGMPFPGDRLGFPTKDEQADYLESYAARFRLPVHTGIRIDRLWREGGHFVASAGERRWESENVVVATGGNGTLKVPPFADELDESVAQLHSSEYRNSAQLRPGPALVVGVGNSGAEIALELSRTRPTILAGAPSGELPVRHGRTAARFVFPLVRFAGLHVLSLGTPIGRRALPKLAAKATPLMRTKLEDLAAAGVVRVARVSGIRDGKPMVDDEGVLDVANVIWCTGYREDHGWLDVPAFGDDGRLVQRRGVVTPVPGLYVLGQEMMYAITSATLPGVVRDAAYLARQMESRRRAPGPRPRSAEVLQP